MVPDQFKKYINIFLPFCREIREGVAITDINGNKLGYSKRAAVEGITLVTLSRIGMATPGMGLYQISIYIYAHCIVTHILTLFMNYDIFL